MTIEYYIKLRKLNKEFEEIREEFSLNEATVLTFELGYICYLNKIPLNSAIELMSKMVSIDPSKGCTTLNPFKKDN